MSRRIALIAMLVGLVAFSVFLVLKRASKKRTVTALPQMVVSDANRAACEASAKEQYARVLVVQLLPLTKENVPSVKLNAEDLTWDQTAKILSEVLRTRVNRTVFLTIGPRVGPAYRSQMIDLMRIANAERICVIDPRNPPEWYPPRYDLAGGSGGSSLPAAAP
jgi:hypothetical protein